MNRGEFIERYRLPFEDWATGPVAAYEQVRPLLTAEEIRFLVCAGMSPTDAAPALNRPDRMPVRSIVTSWQRDRAEHIGAGFALVRRPSVSSAPILRRARPGADILRLAACLPRSFVHATSPQ